MQFLAPWLKHNVLRLLRLSGILILLACDVGFETYVLEQARLWLMEKVYEIGVTIGLYALWDNG